MESNLENSSLHSVLNAFAFDALHFCLHFLAETDFKSNCWANGIIFVNKINLFAFRIHNCKAAENESQIPTIRDRPVNE